MTNHFIEDGKDHVIFGNKTYLDKILDRIADTEDGLASIAGGEI